MNFSNNSFLISALKRGNKKAYIFLIDTYHHTLCAYINSLTNNHIQSEDIVQNVLVKIWGKRDQLNINQSIKSFLFKAVYNEFIDQYRKNQAVIRIECIYMEYLESIMTDEDGRNIEVLIKKVREIIQNLPPKCKQVFELSKKDGLTNMEISEYLDISVKAVEAQITRAFSIVRKKVKK